MKVGQYIAPKKVKATTIKKPTRKEGEALIKVSYAGICGTDMMIYAGKHPRAKAPLTVGHEFCGVVEEIDEGVSVRVGDKVVIEPLLTCGKCAACESGARHVCEQLGLIGIDEDGGFAEYVSVPVDRLHILPETVSEKEGAMIEPLAIAVHTVRRSTLQVGDTVAILGAGPIGLLIGLICKQAGAQKIFISDMSPMRLKKAEEFGFDAVDAKTENIVSAVKQYTNDVGADVVFEVAGNQVTADQMIECMKFQGQIVVASVFKEPPALQLASMHYREIGLITTRCYEKGDYTKAIQLLAQKEINIKPLISHILPLDDIQVGFEAMEQPDETLKVLFKP